MEVNQVPQEQLQTQLASASTMLGSYEKLTSDIATLQSVSDTLGVAFGLAGLDT